MAWPNQYWNQKTMLSKSSSVLHYGDVIMGAIMSQITSLTIVYSTDYSDADQRKHQSSASLAFVWGIHRGPLLNLTGNLATVLPRCLSNVKAMRSLWQPIWRPQDTRSCGKTSARVVNRGPCNIKNQWIVLFGEMYDNRNVGNTTTNYRVIC